MNALRGCSSKGAFKRRVTFADSITVNFFQENVMNCKKVKMSIFHKKLFPNKTKCNNLGKKFFNSTNMITTADFNNLRTHSKFT